MDAEIIPEENMKSLTYTIQNIVVKTSLNLEENIDLQKVSQAVQNTEYNSERFPGLFARFSHPKCVIILFKNGKIILTGLKSFNHIKLALNRLILKLNKILEKNINKNLIHPKVVNIVITANFNIQINLDRAAVKLENSIYEPEVFPGLIFRSIIPVKSVFLIFSTGKVVFTGVNEKEVIEPALINLGRVLNEKKLFRKST
ncbi:MAG: TATA-box-binding protein [Promethearchaeota archaeon]